MRKDAETGLLSPKGVGTVLLRFSLGIVFLAAGMGWIAAPGEITGTWPPSVLVSACMHVLPFAALAVGALLVLGFCTRWAFLAGGLLLFLLALDMMLWQENTIVATSLACLMMAISGLWLAARGNPLSLDRLIERTSDRLFNMK
jgi:uncharacterized membrane protein YphA (DoxX/SURF4 family)